MIMPDQPPLCQDSYYCTQPFNSLAIPSTPCLPLLLPFALALTLTHQAYEERSQRSSLAGASDLDEAVNTAATTDHRRGKRFKKLTRLLATAHIKRVLHRFRIHTLGVVGLLALVHIAIFAYIFVLLENQRLTVKELNNAGGYSGLHVC